MALRKLTRKSVLSFGQYGFDTIQKILDDDPQYIVWVYYNKPEITFFDDILEEVGLVGRFVIDKPSSNPDKFWDDEGRKKLKKKVLTEQEKGLRRKNKYWDKKASIKRESMWESKASFKSKSMGNPSNFK
tara:strand:- start:2114 stop:2503 length:390 start_codon:yes stop_codon:yes gene_type:complete